jgi:RNA polymerase subunit RPABC4/transcription elongation factor Spt4
MKICKKCTALLNDNDSFCSVCGTEQYVPRTITNHRLCAACGAKMNEYDQFCPVCGKPVQNMQPQQPFQQQISPLITKLSNRITVSSGLWLSISCIQLLLAFVFFCYASLFNKWSADNIRAIFVYGIIGGLNVVDVIRNFKFKKWIQTNHIGIVMKYNIKFVSVLFFIWNSYVIVKLILSHNLFLFLVALLSIAAVIVDLISVRLFVINNKENFLQLEKIQVQRNYN